MRKKRSNCVYTRIQNYCKEKGGRKFQQEKKMPNSVVNYNRNSFKVSSTFKTIKI